MNKKPIASVSLDLDNKWAYMRSSKIAGWESYPTYLDIAVPRALDFLSKRELKITFFVVGKDASLAKNHDAIASISKAGHEIGNHSFNHEPWLHLYSRPELVAEIAQAEEAIESVTGQRPRGFRGPGFSLTPAVVEVLEERGYEYDCSVFPTFIGPLARAFYFLKSGEMTPEERELRKRLFGTFRDGFGSLKPSRIGSNCHTLVEIPVTTLPIFKTPIHVSYLMYLASFSSTAAKAYWRTALNLCRLTNIAPSLLLHPLDFLSREDVRELEFFPGMSVATEKKMELLGSIFDSMEKHFTVVPMNVHVTESIRRFPAENEKSTP